MRPTQLNFRSPKEKTAEFNLPVINNQGQVLFKASHKHKPGFPKSKRFTDYEILARITGFRVGPGSYTPDCGSMSKNHIKGTHIYKTCEKNLANNGYFFVGDQLMFDSSFLLTSAKHQIQNINTRIDLSEYKQNNESTFNRQSTASNTPSKKKVTRLKNCQRFLSPQFMYSSENEL